MRYPLLSLLTVTLLALPACPREEQVIVDEEPEVIEPAPPPVDTPAPPDTPAYQQDMQDMNDQTMPRR